MKVQFTRTPPKEFSAYVEGEVADLPEKDARYLVGLGIAAVPRALEGDTRHESSRTEIVGRGNETEVVVRGRGANIVQITSPEADAAKPKEDAPTADPITEEERRVASRAESESLVKQEAGRTGGFIDETAPDPRAKGPVTQGAQPGKTTAPAKEPVDPKK